MVSASKNCFGHLPPSDPRYFHPARGIDGTHRFQMAWQDRKPGGTTVLAESGPPARGGQTDLWRFLMACWLAEVEVSPAFRRRPCPDRKSEYRILASVPPRCAFLAVRMNIELPSQPGQTALLSARPWVQIRGVAPASGRPLLDRVVGEAVEAESNDSAEHMDSRVGLASTRWPGNKISGGRTG